MDLRRESFSSRGEGKGKALEKGLCLDDGAYQGGQCGQDGGARGREVGRGGQKGVGSYRHDTHFGSYLKQPC